MSGLKSPQSTEAHPIDKGPEARFKERDDPEQRRGLSAC